MHGRSSSFICADSYLGSLEEEEETGSFRLGKRGSRHQGMHGRSFSFICADSYLGSLEEVEIEVEEKSSFRLRK
jgi:hypothetical protein